MRYGRVAALIVALCFSPQPRAQLIGNIAFSPSRPTSNDQVTVVFTPAEGQPDSCAGYVFIQSTTVFVDSFGTLSGSCGNLGIPDKANLGKLPAGVYQVTWGFHDNFYGALFPTESLTVTAAPVRVPALSRFGILSLALCLILLGLRGRLGRA